MQLNFVKGEGRACAAGHLTGRTDKKLLVYMKGGDLVMEMTPEGILKTGPARLTFRGSVTYDI